MWCDLPFNVLIAHQYMQILSYLPSRPNGAILLFDGNNVYTTCVVFIRCYGVIVICYGVCHEKEKLSTHRDNYMGFIRISIAYVYILYRRQICRRTAKFRRSNVQNSRNLFESVHGALSALAGVCSCAATYASKCDVVCRHTPHTYRVNLMSIARVWRPKRRYWARERSRQTRTVICLCLSWWCGDQDAAHSGVAHGNRNSGMSWCTRPIVGRAALAVSAALDVDSRGCFPYKCGVCVYVGFRSQALCRYHPHLIGVCARSPIWCKCCLIIKWN